MWMLAIDPGPERSGYVILDTEHPDDPIWEYGHVENESLYFTIGGLGATLPLCDACVIEDVGNYGNVVGKSIFDTAKEIGALRMLWKERWPTRIYREIKRSAVRLELAGHQRASDAQIKQNIRDMFPQTGGGKNPDMRAVGTKKQPGPLYGIKGDHMYDALGLALAFQIIQERGNAT